MNTLSAIVERVIDIGRSVEAEDHAFNSDKPKLAKVIEGLRRLKQQCDLILQQPGQNPRGPATPVPPPSMTGSAVVSPVITRDIISSFHQEIALENAKFQV